MGGGNRRTDHGGNIEPYSRRQQRRHHEPDKFIPVRYHRRVNNAFFDGSNHVTASKQGAAGFKCRSNQDCTQHGERARANRRPHVIGYIIGTDIERHIAANHRRDYQQASAAPRVNTSRNQYKYCHNKQAGNAHPEKVSSSHRFSFKRNRLGNQYYSFTTVL